MVPGEVDLTENLDFRKIVKKEIPQLPVSWNKGGQISLNDRFEGYYTTTLNTSSYNTYYIADRNSYTTIDNTYTINYYNGSSIMEWIAPIDYILEDSLEISNFNTYDYYTSYYNSSVTTTISVKNSFTSKEPEYDMFGNIKPPLEVIPSIPWKRNKINITEKQIPWRNKYDDTIIHRDLKKDKRIAWEDDIPTVSTVLKMDNIVIKARHYISWLADKTMSFIEAHLKSEDDHDPDDLRYLNNMSWIRVKDAIVD